MVQIVLTDEQAEIARSATGPLELWDRAGRLIGSVVRGDQNDPDFTPEEIAEARRRMRNPGRLYTTAEVLEHLDSLAREGK